MFFGNFMKSGLSAVDAVSGARDGSVKVIDVREVAEVMRSGKAKGAKNIPLTRLRDMIDPRHPDFIGDLKPDDKIALYCASGARSMNARMAMKSMGYNDVHNIGGFQTWLNAGGAIERA